MLGLHLVDSNIVVCICANVFIFKCEFVPITISTVDADAQDLPETLLESE